jgi:hypothetical protein
VPFHLAEFNRAKLGVAIDDPGLVPFLTAVGPVLEAAEAADGFVARNSFLGPFTRPNPFPDDELATISLWEGLDELRAYTFSAPHRDLLRRRGEWFTRASEPKLVLWWAPAGQLPEPAEAVERLERLTENGPTPDAFSFARPFDAPR